MRSQWESFLQNLGVWVGSFTKFTPKGEQTENRKSHLQLESFDDNQTVKLTLQREGLSDLLMEFTTLSKSLLFFENGAFCQGSIQFSPLAEFGAEFGFIYENRRLRLVQLFDNNSNLSSLTLIRECREGTTTNEIPTLTIEALLGEWKGEAITIYPDLREPDIYSTSMKLKLDTLSGKLVQTSSFANHPEFTSTATINGSMLTFDSNPENLVQVLMLPGGVSATSPVKAQLNQPLFLEAGWLIKSNVRQRMIRSYNQQGEWVSLTLVTEKKVEN